MIISFDAVRLRVKAEAYRTEALAFESPDRRAAMLRLADLCNQLADQWERRDTANATA